MKPVYLGGMRGHQSAFYRPGTGWSGGQSHHHSLRQPAVYKRSLTVCASPLSVARRRRPGLRTKTAIVAVLVAIAGLLAIVLSGATQL